MLKLELFLKKLKLIDGILINTELNKPVNSYRREGYNYCSIPGVCGKSIAEHHIIWYIHTGKFPVGDIDHINMDRADNRIENLRECSRSQNMLNTKAHRESSSGVKNVFFRKDTNKWSVRMSIDGVYKSLGSFGERELAELVAEEGRAKYHKEFANA